MSALDSAGAVAFTAEKHRKNGGRIIRDFRRNNQLYFMIIPVLVFYALFQYAPIYGIVVAFENYNVAKGIFHSPWVGFRNFVNFFQSAYFSRVFINTILLSLCYYIFVFPCPIILALLLNEVKNRYFKNIVQTISYLPYFISLVVVCGLVIEFTSKGGLIFDIARFFGAKDISLLLRPELFRVIYTAVTIWTTVGWSSIIYLAALSTIDSALYEAAHIDGAGRWKQMWYITLPGIAPTVTTLLILAIGTFMNIDFEKVLLLYNPGIYSTADVISTYVYRSGLTELKFGYSAAVDLFNSLINLVMIVFANFFSRKISGHSLW